ncbi:MAG TPA: SprT-like domain-containing protein [Candidatus Limnocylindrales bacterium]|nr:SprT-like domain-containing protein [Candidatus Limnocylindrales bacterium]
MSLQNSELPQRLQKRVAHWLSRWDTPSLADTLRIEFSPRLRRAFGRCYQEEQLIRLTPSLRDSQSHLLAEILCHEAAHAAVFELYGNAARPHGSEWEELMRMAGFEPRVRIPVVVRSKDAESRIVYLHHCPNCERSRHAARPMHRWRCRTCLTEGSDGRLVIRREEAARKKRPVAPERRDRKRAAASKSSLAGSKHPRPR